MSRVVHRNSASMVYHILYFFAMDVMLAFIS